MDEPDSGDFDPDTGAVAIPITDVFDLHTVPPRDVSNMVEAYLEEVHVRGFTAIRIVHGRGIGVQRETVRKILARTPYVRSFTDAPLEAGGWGATIATLEPIADSDRKGSQVEGSHSNER